MYRLSVKRTRVTIKSTFRGLWIEYIANSVFGCSQKDGGVSYASDRGKLTIDDVVSVILTSLFIGTSRVRLKTFRLSADVNDPTVRARILLYAVRARFVLLSRSPQPYDITPVSHSRRFTHSSAGRRNFTRPAVGIRVIEVGRR